jgi:hypothetical protein
MHEEAFQPDREVILKRILGFLTREKGYDPGEIEQNLRYALPDPDKPAEAKIDLALVLDGRRFLIVRICPGDLTSRERPALALARLLEPYRIPLVVVTNGKETRLLETAKGSLAAESLEGIPSREEALKNWEKMGFEAVPDKKREMEKRILSSFEAIRCENICEV